MPTPRRSMGKTDTGAATRVGDPGAKAISQHGQGDGDGLPTGTNGGGAVTVMVTRVYANGNMWIEGQKLLSVSQGEEYVRVSGLVRPDDIGPGNTVEGLL